MTLTGAGVRIGIYGGSFAPVHHGHLRAARAFLEECALDRLVLMPAGIPPHKQLTGEDLPTHRLAMLRLAAEEELRDPRVEVSDYELTQAGISYTYRTLEHFAAPDRQLLLLVGTDMFLSLDRWRYPERIFALAEIVLARRESDAAISTQIAEKTAAYQAQFGAVIHRLSLPPLELSSTNLRRQIAEASAWRDKVPTSVANYLQANGLYRSVEKDEREGQT